MDTTEQLDATMASDPDAQMFFDASVENITTARGLLGSITAEQDTAIIDAAYAALSTWLATGRPS